jgi:hypothetical protein
MRYENACTFDTGHAVTMFLFDYLIAMNSPTGDFFMDEHSN